MPIRKLVLNLHLCAGLLAAIFLFVMGVSGALTVFEGQIDRALNPQQYPYVQPRSERAPLSTLKAALEGAHPGYRLLGFEFPDRADLPCWGFLESERGALQIAVNPHTAQIIPTPDHRNDLANEIHQFHTHLLSQPWGSTILGYADLLLVFLALSGPVLWWRRKILTVSWRSPGTRLNFDLHNTVGFCSSVFLLIFALTGVAIHWEDTAAKLANRLARSPAQTEVPPPPPHSPGAVPLNPDVLLQIAERAVPGARPTAMELAMGPTDPVRVILKFPEDHTPAGRSNVLMDEYTGKILFAQGSRTAPLGFRITELWNREIHTGDIFGWPTRLLACVFSLSLPLLAISGPLIWWSRRQRSPRGAK